jgi:hypothetical protein
MLTTDMTYPFSMSQLSMAWICERFVHFQGRTRHDRDTRPPLQSLETGDQTISAFRSCEIEGILRPCRTQPESERHRGRRAGNRFS